MNASETAESECKKAIAKIREQLDLLEANIGNWMDPRWITEELEKVRKQVEYLGDTAFDAGFQEV